MPDPNREPRALNIEEPITKSSFSRNTWDSIPKSLLRLIYMDRIAPVRDLFLTRKSWKDELFDAFETEKALQELAQLTDPKIGGGEVKPVVPDYYQRIVTPEDDQIANIRGSVHLPGFGSFDYLPHVSGDTLKRLSELPFDGFGFTYTSRVTPGPISTFHVPSGSVKKYENSDKGFMRHIGYEPIYREEQHPTEQMFVVKVSAGLREEIVPELKVSAGRVKRRKGFYSFEDDNVSTKTFDWFGGWSDPKEDAESLRSFLADQVKRFSAKSPSESFQRWKRELTEGRKEGWEYEELRRKVDRRNTIRQGLGLRPIQLRWDGYKWKEV